MAVATVSRTVGNLPAELTSFVGRRNEITEAKAKLSQTRLVTLTGTGGVGKTRLARRLLVDIHRAFPDGVWQVELAELADAALVATTIATALGLHEPQGRWTVGKLQESLADKHLLLLLDNCEHLIDACAITADALLRACPELYIVATSRQPLGIEGEQTLPVPPLQTADPNSQAQVGSLDDYDAARLFVERATAARSDFALDAGNQQAVAHLCHRLDGLPLAIELAARRLSALSPEEVLERLDEDFRLSSPGSRIAPTRQQTLRGLVDWSYQLCTPAERELWCQLSVCRGPFDLETVEGICADIGPDAVDLVVGLVDKSVIVRESRGGSARYRMLETIRDYGHEQLEAAGLVLAARRSHRDFYLQVSERAHTAYSGPDQLHWFTRMREQHPDVRAALECSLSEPGGAELAVAQLIALLDYWLAFGFISEGRYWLSRALEQLTEPSLPRAQALRASAYWAAFQGDAADDLLREAAELTDDPQELAWITYTSGAAALFLGDPVEATTLFAEAAARMRAIGDDHGLADTLTAHAVAASVSGGVEVAEQPARELIALADQTGERWLKAYVLWALGVATWRAGDPETAAAMERESLAIRLTFDDHLGLIWSAEALAWIAAGQGDARTAAVLLGAATKAAESLGSEIGSFAFLVEDHERCTAEVRAALGQAGYDSAVRRGRVLRPAEILELVSGEPAPEEPAATRRVGAGPLTAREAEIAELVAAGLSNKEIAARLVIALRTAEGHVERILVKLGFTSRTQVATWVAENR